MVAGLIGAATIAVIAVLAGSFSDTFGKALFTLGLVVLHALICLAFLERTIKSSRSFKFFENSFFIIIVLSFLTSIFGVWEIFPGELVAKLYGTYFILLFACLHGQMLDETKAKQTYIDNIVLANYALMAIVILFILPLIWVTDAEFGDFYYRLLAAAGIIDATLTILAVIFHRMYVQKHPEIQSTIFSVVTQPDASGNVVPISAQVQKRRFHPLIWLLGIFLLAQLVISVLFGLLGAFYA